MIRRPKIQGAAAPTAAPATPSKKKGLPVRREKKKDQERYARIRKKNG